MPSTDPPLLSTRLHDDALARWRRAAESASDGLFEFDATSRQVWYADRFSALLGLGPGALSGELSSFTTRIHADDLTKWRQAWDAALDRGEPLEVTLRVLHHSGDWRWYSVRARCWSGTDGRAAILAGALADVHDHLHAQMALEHKVAERTASLARAVEAAERGRADALHARQAQGRFLAHMSHELRTPLAGVLGLMDLAHRVTADPSQRRYLEVAMQSGRALQRTIDQLLDLSLLRDGDLPDVSAPFDLAEAVSEVLRNAMPVVRDKGLSVRFDWLGEPTWVSGNEPRLRQIVGNLIGNAAKFTEQGHIAVVGTLTGHPDRAGWRWLKLDIEDTGPGLDATAASRIFDDFVQGDASLSRAHGGTGLGLSIARELSRRLGGDVTLRSVVGQGSVFTVTMPLLAADDPDPLPDPAPGVAWLLYQQPAIGEWLQRRLTRLGWQAEILGNGAATVARAAALPIAERPSLVVVAEHVLEAGTDLASLRQALPQAAITLLIRPDWNQPALEQQALALDMSFSIMPLTPRDLRLLTARPAAAVALQAPPTPFGPGHVLVVEDNAVNRMIAEEFLRTLGIAAQTAEDGAQALAACASAPPRLVLMDLQMPVMDGLAATRALRERQQRGELPEFPIIALTAHAMGTDAQACHDAGMVGYLTKPLLLDALREEVSRWWPAR